MCPPCICSVQGQIQAIKKQCVTVCYALSLDFLFQHIKFRGIKKIF